MFRTLPTISVAGVSELTWPEDHQQVTLDSPATTVFTDFRVAPPLIVDGNISIAEAESLMRRSHVRLKLVVGPSGEFLGTLAYRDLVGSKPKALAAAGTSAGDVSVADVMTPRSELRAITLDKLESATVGDLVETLKEEHQQHFLVVDADGERICGLLSASDLARRLHIEIDVSPSPGFLDVCHAIGRQRRA